MRASGDGPIGDIDLRHLTESERDFILSVIRKDEILREKEHLRIQKLQREVRELRRKGALRVGQKAEKGCARCRSPLGWIFNSGATCPKCKHKVCDDCRTLISDSAWTCVLCFKQAELQAVSNQWFFSRFRRSKRHLKTNKVICGTELVRASIRSRPDSQRSFDGHSRSDESLEFDERHPHASTDDVFGETVPNGSNESAKRKCLPSVRVAGVRVRHPVEADQQILNDLMKNSLQFDPASNQLSYALDDSDSSSAHSSPKLLRPVADSLRSSLRSQCSIVDNYPRSGSGSSTPRPRLTRSDSARRDDEREHPVAHDGLEIDTPEEWHPEGAWPPIERTTPSPVHLDPHTDSKSHLADSQFSDERMDKVLHIKDPGEAKSDWKGPGDLDLETLQEEDEEEQEAAKDETDFDEKVNCTTNRINTISIQESTQQSNLKKLKQQLDQTNSSDTEPTMPRILEEEAANDPKALENSLATSDVSGTGHDDAGNGKPATPVSLPGRQMDTARTISQSRDQTEQEPHAPHRLQVEFEEQKTVSSFLSTSRESLNSFYSSTGEGTYGKIQITGQIQFSIDYDYKQTSLNVRVKQCKDLAIADKKKKRTDSYVKIYLLPDKTRNGKRKTRVKKHTTDPKFDEILKWNLMKSELDTRTLWISVWHNDTFGRNDFLGEVLVALDEHQFEDTHLKWHALQERNAKVPTSQLVLTYQGDLILSLKFVSAENAGQQPQRNGTPTSRRQGTGELHILVKEARNLPAIHSNGSVNPFCKAYLLPDKLHKDKQKTPVIKKDYNPQWNHTFIFEDITRLELAQKSLEISVWDHDRFTSNSFLGGVRLNLATGKCNGEPVDWMDARGEEVSRWQAMIDRPNCWIDAGLMLRANMDERK